jgi:unsaturated rhamnogalacturonyl hydrolase
MLNNPGESPWSVQVADSLIKRLKILGTKWDYEWGVALKGIEQVWLATGHDKYFSYIKENTDSFVLPDGTIRTYKPTEYNIDHINTGKLLFSLAQATNDTRYTKAIHTLREQMQTHPRNSEGGYWHKNIYPHQMWLDGIYMAGPFLAQYAKTMDEPNLFDDVAHQIELIERHTRDPQTGLLFHGWDESREQKWANPETGCSPHLWGRAIGWFVMALVDVLDYLPIDHPKRGQLIDIFKQTIDALLRVQGDRTGLWYQILDLGDRTGNYLEASASCMVTYSIAKAIRHGYLGQDYRKFAQKAHAGILEHLVEVDEKNAINLHNICGVAGLGGTPYRDGSYEYYVGEPIVTNDYKGVGPLIMAMVEIERLSLSND